MGKHCNPFARFNLKGFATFWELLFYSKKKKIADEYKSFFWKKNQYNTIKHGV